MDRAEWSGLLRPAWNQWAVVTFNRDLAVEMIGRIEQEYPMPVNFRRIHRHAALVQFEDGITLRWISPVESARGNRIGKMWCDKTIDRDIFELIIRRCYMGKSEDIIWF